MSLHSRPMLSMNIYRSSRIGTPRVAKPKPQSRTPLKSALKPQRPSHLDRSDSLDSNSSSDSSEAELLFEMDIDPPVECEPSEAPVYNLIPPKSKSKSLLQRGLHALRIQVVIPAPPPPTPSTPSSPSPRQRRVFPPLPPPPEMEELEVSLYSDSNSEETCGYAESDSSSPLTSTSNSSRRRRVRFLVPDDSDVDPQEPVWSDF
ncbi:hypothetical protein C8F01DRAFT_160277 [Mycena amicta]|nr:hypothetical protein C8F01DRAFT_160277 [Mycena amicta]